MAEEKEITSIEYYEHKFKRLLPGKTDIYPGLYNESILKTKAKTAAQAHVPDDSLKDPNDATSEKGWIAPYDYYKEDTRQFNSDRSVSNGMVQKSDAAEDSDIFYKNLYWWNEDLHNWCVYKSDCINFPYLNSFYLHVWNGLNKWVPATYSFYADWTEKFAPLQNSIIYNKLQRGECIVMHRGAMKDTPNKWAFTNGPLTINHGFVLKKSDKFSVNSDNNFQTIRWSTPKHIQSSSEYEDANRLMRLNSDGEMFLVDIRFRSGFAATDSYKLILDHGHPWCQGHKFNACDKGTSYSCTFENFTSDESNGHLVYKKESQCNSYNNLDRTIYWNNTLANGITNKAITSDFIDKFGDTNIKTPLNYRGEVYNHILLNAFAMEKVFAVYFYKQDPTTGNAVLLQNNWLNQDIADDDPDKITVNGVTTAPIYMSYIDIQMLFYKGMREYWTMPARRSNGRTEVYSYDVWKIKNYPMLVAILSMLHPASTTDPGEYFNYEYAEQEEFVSAIVDGIHYATVPTVLFNINNDTTTGKLQVGELRLLPLIAAGMSELYKPQVSDYILTAFTGGILNGVFTQGSSFGENVLGAALGVVGFSVLGGPGAVLALYAINVYQKHKNANTIEMPKWSVNIYNYTETNSVYSLDSIEMRGSQQDQNYCNSVSTGLLNGLNSGFDRTKHIENYDSTLWGGYKVFIATKPVITDPVTSNLREGLSIGNPAVYRLPSGDILLASQLHWGGKNYLIGGPGDKVYNSVQYADKFINEVCQGYFGKGLDKTIDVHWLKEYKIEKDQDSQESGLVNNAALESGFVFEQINNNNTERFKMTVETTRPVVITSVSGENVDTAKKW